MVLIDMGLYSHIPGGHFKIHILNIQDLSLYIGIRPQFHLLEKKIVRTETDMARF